MQATKLLPHLAGQKKGLRYSHIHTKEILLSLFQDQPKYRCLQMFPTASQRALFDLILLCMRGRGNLHQLHLSSWSSSTNMLFDDLIFAARSITTVDILKS